MEFWPKVAGTLYRSCTGRFNDRERFFLPESERPRVMREARLMAGLYVVVGTVCGVTGTWPGLLAFWLLPRVVAEPALRS